MGGDELGSEVKSGEDEVGEDGWEEVKSSKGDESGERDNSENKALEIFNFTFYFFKFFFFFFPRSFLAFFFWFFIIFFTLHWPF